jgi:hypothetical protein
MDAIRSTETSVCNKPIRNHIPEDSIPVSHLHENLKSYAAGSELDSCKPRRLYSTYRAGPEVLGSILISQANVLFFSTPSRGECRHCCTVMTPPTACPHRRGSGWIYEVQNCHLMISSVCDVGCLEMCLCSHGNGHGVSVSVTCGVFISLRHKIALCSRPLVASVANCGERVASGP